MKIIDISQELLGASVYEGDPAPRLEGLVSMDEGGIYNLSAISLCLHNGTHIDAPKHFIKDGKAIEEIPLSTLVGRCYVADHKGNVSAADAEEIMKKAMANDAGARILLRGDLTVTEEAARVFAREKILLLGNEGQTVGPKDAPMAVHLILLGCGTVLLEGIVLDEADEGVYLLNAAPINIKGAEGSPCRAWLIKD